MVERIREPEPLIEITLGQRNVRCDRVVMTAQIVVERHSAVSGGLGRVRVSTLASVGLANRWGAGCRRETQHCERARGEP